MPEITQKSPLDIVNAGHLLITYVFMQGFSFAKKMYSRAKGDDLIKQILANQVIMLANQVEILRLCVWLYEAHNLRDSDGTFMWMIRRSMTDQLTKVGVTLTELDKSLSAFTPQVLRELEDITEKIAELVRETHHRHD